LFKGATAAFFLRHHQEVPDDGAVWVRTKQQDVVERMKEQG
jgi:hypothetical protein